MRVPTNVTVEEIENYKTGLRLAGIEVGEVTQDPNDPTLFHVELTFNVERCPERLTLPADTWIEGEAERCARGSHVYQMVEGPVGCEFCGKPRC